MNVQVVTGNESPRMKALMVLLGVMLCACGPMTATDAGVGSGGGGGGGGGGNSGGGAQDGGADAGAGGGTTGDAGVGTFSISGTVQAPSGSDVNSLVVIACAWINDDCDADKTVGVQLTGSGASAAWQLNGLEQGLTYFVVFWKDVNGSGTVDDGDLGAVATDAQGNVRAFTGSASSVSTFLAVKQTPAVTSVPTALVGDWLAVNVSIGLSNHWSFHADASATNEFILTSSTCSGGGIATLANGRLSVTGNELTFTPSDATRNYRCNGTSTVTATYVNQRHFQWRVGPSTKTSGNALFLTDLGPPPDERVEAEFQVL